MTAFPGRTAAVTGAASGIGRALALELSSSGASLALADIDEAGLAETVSLCNGKDRTDIMVTSARVDVADRDAVYGWADRVVADHGSVNFIFNNAGVALMASVEAMSYDDLEWVMRTNFWGVVYGTKAFLPHLRAAGEGHIVNLSSVFGLVSVPGMSAYNASKFAVRGFTDALRIDSMPTMPACPAPPSTPVVSGPISPARPVWTNGTRPGPGVPRSCAGTSTGWR